MALPASGAISLFDVNTELGLTHTAQLGLLCTNVRTLFGTASGAVGLQTGYGKSNTLAFNGFNTPADISATYVEMTSVAVNSSGLFVAIGSDGSNYPRYATSSDGSTWTTPIYMSPNGSCANIFMAIINSVAVNSSGLFVAVGYKIGYNASYQYPVYATSSNGSDWTTPHLMNCSTTAANMNSVAVNSSGLFVAVGLDSNSYGAPRYATSSDGSTWTTPAAMGSGSDFVNMNSVAVNSSGLFVAVGTTGCYYPRYATSSNGSTWTTPAAMNGSTTKAYMKSVAVNSSGLFVAVGYDYNCNTPLYATSSNGSTWTTPAAMNGSGIFARMQSVAVNNAGVFVAVGYNNSYSLYATSSDGSTWTTPTKFNGSSDYIRMNSVTANKSGLFVSVGINVGVGHSSYAKSN
jgi:hypothetical protein